MFNRKLIKNLHLYSHSIGANPRADMARGEMEKVFLLWYIVKPHFKKCKKKNRLIC